MSPVQQVFYKMSKSIQCHTYKSYKTNVLPLWLVWTVISFTDSHANQASGEMLFQPFILKVVEGSVAFQTAQK
jgi:hypothetical protein